MGQRFLGCFPQWTIVGSMMTIAAGCALSPPQLPPPEMTLQGGTRADAPASSTMGHVTVSMRNLKFAPSTVTVSAGTTVTWVNNDPQGAPHTSTSDTGLWDSGRMNVGKTYSHTFDQPGTYSYHCTFHQDEGMVGTIIVK